MSSLHRPLSIHNLSPLEMGGPIARSGFEFQDHVAASFCMDMAIRSDLKSVWFETYDDITLIWDEANSDFVEFIQVKSNKPDQLWSIALLCEREKSRKNPQGIGTSILEKSLAHDRCIEKCKFRLITSENVKQELKLLTFPINHHTRTQQSAFDALDHSVSQKITAVVSANGNGVRFWLTRTLWDVRGSEEAVHDHNLILLENLISKEGGFLAIDQRRELYLKLLRKVQVASKANWIQSPAAKKLNKQDFLDWFRDSIAQIQHPVVIGGGHRLQRKMHMAGLSEDEILTAIEQRKFYYEQTLNPQFLSLSDSKLAFAEVTATLQGLRSQLDCGTIQDNGVAFHSRCLAELRDLHERWENGPPLAFLHGCMYDITNRCLHRFQGVQP